MRRKGHFFPEQHENEKIILFTRRHWVVFVGQLFWALVVGTVMASCLYAAYYYLPYFQENPAETELLWAIGMIVALMIWLTIYIAWVDYYLDVWIVTNERIVEIKQNTLFNRQISELELDKIQDINAKVVGMWGTFLGYGTILVQTAGAMEMFEFLRIPRPYDVQKVVLSLRTKLEEHGKEHLADLFGGQIHRVKDIQPLLNYPNSGGSNPLNNNNV